LILWLFGADAISAVGAEKSATSEEITASFKGAKKGY
jgi:hypothetical protein